jgi:hypothetical protein
MRQFFKSSAGFVVLSVVGLIVAAGGTATAAKLITSADIKNGTIKGKDIKAATITEKQLSGGVKAKLNAGGPQGPKGEPGAAAPGGFVVNGGDGKTVSGWVAVEGDTLLRVVDGALWRYRWDGTLANDFVHFTEPNCTGSALDGVGSEGLPNPQRAVHAANGQGYRYGNAAPQIRNVKSRFASDGQCDAFPVTLQTVELVPVNAPPALTGPLTVKANP